MRATALVWAIVLPLAPMAGCGGESGFPATEWQRLNQQTASLFEQGKYDRAIVVAKKALEVAEREFVGPNHPAVAASLNNLAFLYHKQGEYAEAEPLYKRALPIMEKALGSNHPNVAKVLERMSALYETVGRTELAKESADRAARIRESKR